MDFYHVLNRGVDKRVVFQDKQDYVRFQRNLFLLNDIHDAPTNEWTIKARLRNNKREKIVTIHAYCLMNNHYHILLSPLVENGISLFMKKVNAGYSRYFNERNERKGALWQGKYKCIPIKQDNHFEYIPFYIHLNSLDISMPKWRTGGVTNFNKALSFLDKYRWSSHDIFLNPEKAPGSIIDGSFFATKNSNQVKYLNEIKNIISTKSQAEPSYFIET